MLEYLYKKEWIGTGFHAMFFGFIYAVIGIFISIILFPNNAGTVSLGVISVLMIPTFNAFLKSAVNKTDKKNTFYQRNHEIIKVLLLIFLGIFFAFFLIGFLFDFFHFQSYFSSQLRILGISGDATNQDQLFSNIVKNNIIVFLICFIVSLVLGAGSILFLAWNASVWGIAINYFIRQAIDGNSGINPFVLFFSVLMPFLPHLITEAMAYVNASIVGGIASKAMLQADFKVKNFWSSKFKAVFLDSVIYMIVGFCLVLIAGAIEVYLF